MAEPGGESVEAAIRDVEKETALNDPRFDWGAEFIDTDRNRCRKIDRYYLSGLWRREISTLMNPDIGGPERFEFRRIGLQETIRMATPRIRPVVLWALAHIGVRIRSPA
jgi:hypothetical protein